MNSCGGVLTLAFWLCFDIMISMKFCKQLPRCFAWCFLVFAILLVNVVPSNVVGALSLERKRTFNQNNIIFLDTDGEKDDCDDETNANNTKCVAPSGDQITWIGDSYSVDAQSLGLLDEKFSGADYSGHIQYSKFIDSDPGNNPSGLSILEDIVNAGKLRKNLVFALGTNGGDWDDNKLNRLLELAGDETNIVLVTSWTPRPDTDYTNNNAFLKNAASAHSNISVADWAGAAKEEYYVADPDKIHPQSGDGYEIWTDLILEALPSNCSAGLLGGSTIEEKIWNYFVNAGITGVSDNPAVIAGILGNIYVESGNDPFNVTQTGDFIVYGLYQESNTALKDAVDNAGLSQYWENGSSAPVEVVDKAIQVELDYLTQQNPRWTGAGGQWSNVYFVGHLNDVDDTGSPESYADLFMVAVEGCFPGGSGAIEDSKVLQLAKNANSSWGQSLWQMASSRRDAARDIYDRLASAATGIPSGSSSGFSGTDTLSGTANHKYAAEGGEIEKLVKFAVWEAGQTDGDYKIILSSMIDDYELSGVGEAGDITELIKYVEENSNFKYRADYDEYSTLSDDITLTSEQREAGQSILNVGLRPTSGAQEKVESGKKSGVDPCPDGKGRSGKGAASIAETAALMAWPVQSWQTGSSDYESDRVGKCYNDFDTSQKNQWISYTFNVTCRNTPRDLYREAYPKENRLDCGIFSLTVLKYLGLIDDNFFAGGQPGAGDNFRSRSDEWKEVEVSSEGVLEPGDVLWNKNHIMIYVGSEYGGEFGIVAHASVGCAGGCQLPGEGGRVGQISGHDSLTSYTAFRYIGDKLGGGEGDYFTSEQIADFMSKWNSLGEQSYDELKKLAAEKGISEDNFIGLIAWARYENYEQSDYGAYFAYLCNSVGVNNAIAYSQNGQNRGWLSKIESWGGDYADAQKFGGGAAASASNGYYGYYQSNLKSVRMALDYTYPDIYGCSGRPQWGGGYDPAYHNSIYDPKGTDGQWGDSLIFDGDRP